MIEWSLFKFGKGVPREVVRLTRAREAKAMEAQVRARVNARDKRRCFWGPTCRTAAYHKHHQVYRSHGGAFETSNLISGCEIHHRWVHKGLIRLSGNPDLGPVTVTPTALGVAAGIRVPQRRTV